MMQFSIMTTGWHTNPDILKFSRSVRLCQQAESPWRAAQQASVFHYLPEFVQLMSIQPSHPLSSLSLAFSLSQHQGLFQWVGPSHQVAKVLGVSASASVLPMNIQDWFPLGFAGLIPFQSKGLSRIFSRTTVQRHQFFSAQYFLLSSFHICT